MSRPPFPPFNAETARQKVRMAEDAWNSRDPVRVSLAYTEDSTWRNRSEFFVGREAIVEFLTRKWGKERDYRLIKDLWAFHENRIAVRFHGSLTRGNSKPSPRIENEAWVAAKFSAIPVRCSDSHQRGWSAPSTMRRNSIALIVRPSTANATAIAILAGTSMRGAIASRKIP